MSALPSFAKVPVTGRARPTTANTKNDGSGTVGTDMYLLATTDATYGMLLESVRAFPVGNVANVSFTQVTVRFYVSSVGPTGTLTTADTDLLCELYLPAGNVDLSTGITNFYEFPVRKAIGPGKYIYCSIHSAPATNTGVVVLLFGAQLAA